MELLDVVDIAKMARPLPRSKLRVCTLVDDVTRRFGGYFERVAIIFPIAKVNSCGGEMRLEAIIVSAGVERFHFVSDGSPISHLLSLEFLYIFGMLPFLSSRRHE